MAEQTPVPQTLRFEDGTLDVVRSFSSKNGLLHMTVDNGFYFGPGKPLTNDEIPDNLPEPYHTLAHEFVAAQAPPPPEGGEGGVTRDADEESSSSSYSSSRRRR